MKKQNNQFIFVHTEFSSIEDPHLISIGMITEDGKHELYLERNDYDKKILSPYTKAVVEPLLTTKGYPLHEISQMVYSWLAMLPSMILNVPQNYQIMINYQTDWDLLYDLVENFPRNVDIDPNLIRGQITTEAVIYGMKTGNVKETYNRSLNVYKMARDDYFFTKKEKQHHALSEVRAMRYSWLMAKESFLAKTY